MSSSCIFLTFLGSNQKLLRTEAQNGELLYPLTRRASIKDIIEALGVPHSEVGKIVLAGKELDFQFLPEGLERIEIHPFTRLIPVTTPTLLRPEPFSSLRFMVDINALKLGRNLRLVGLDTVTVPGGSLIEIAAEANRGQRILVTRNRELLKIRSVVFGQLLYSEQHQEQLREVCERYAVNSLIKPFSRCLSCNGILRPVTKDAILHLLEPLTIQYFNEFRQCVQCAKVYWKGSHHEKMERLIEQIKQL